MCGQCRQHFPFSDFLSYIQHKQQRCSPSSHSSSASSNEHADWDVCTLATVESSSNVTSSDANNRPTSSSHSSSDPSTSSSGQASSQKARAREVIRDLLGQHRKHDSSPATAVGVSLSVGKSSAAAAPAERTDQQSLLSQTKLGRDKGEGAYATLSPPPPLRVYERKQVTTLASAFNRRAPDCDAMANSH